MKLPDGSGIVGHGRLHRAEDHQGHRWMFVEPAG